MKMKQYQKKWMMLGLCAEQMQAIRLAAREIIEIAQGYISYAPYAQAWIRSEKNGSKSSYTQEIKQLGYEVGIKLSATGFRKLWPLTKWARVEKTRYCLGLSPLDLVAKVDVYHGALEGHVTVAVEFPSEQHAKTMILPEFFGEVVDVTADERYDTLQLVTHGWPQD